MVSIIEVLSLSILLVIPEIKSLLWTFAIFSSPSYVIAAQPAQCMKTFTYMGR